MHQTTQSLWVWECEIMTDINLLSGQKEKLLESKRAVKLFRIISVGCLLFVLVLSVGIFFIKTSSPLSSLQNQEKMFLSEFDSSKQKVAKLYVLSDRLKNIDGILSKRSNFDKTIDALIKQSPEGLQIDSLSLSKKTVLMTIYSSSLNSINTFIDNLMVLTRDKKLFKKITLENLSTDMKATRYSFSIKADL